MEDVFDDLLTNSAVFPSQFGGRRASTPHQNLALALLVQAVDDLSLIVVDTETAAAAESAAAWIASLNEDSPVSFDTCCYSAKFDPGKLRNALAALSIAGQLRRLSRSAGEFVFQGLVSHEAILHEHPGFRCSRGHPRTTATIYVTRKQGKLIPRCLQCAREARHQRFLNLKRLIASIQRRQQARQAMR